MNVVDVLVEKHLITAKQLAEAQDFAHQNDVRVDRALVELGFIDEDEMLRTASEQLSIPFRDLAGLQIDRDAVNAMPAKLVHQKRLLPVSRHNGTLEVATSDPYDLYAFDELRLLTKLNIEPVLAPDDQIKQLIKTYYGVGGDTLDAMLDDVGVSLDEADTQAEDLADMAQEASVIKLVNEIFLEAIESRTSDIHIEPYENDLKIRYRIDGVLQDAKVPPQVRRFQAAIISRIKIMANLNIAEKRLPQDGRIKLQAGGRQIDIRVSVIPMLFGEGIVMRILDKASVLFTLKELGMSDDDYQRFDAEIAKPNGIILVTGPTGSGKTTTLYAALNAIVDDQIKVLTVEDPVEYHLEGVNQIQVNPKIDMSFARGLRAILRHDPDVVMIGEIRDRETAEAAIQAAMTGHLVLSTLHTNDACSAATRLVDMGVEPFLVTSTLNAAMAQRLVRKICDDCREEYIPDFDSLPKGCPVQPGQKLWRGAGCRKCHNTGYRGRSAVFELMVSNEEFVEQVMNRASTTAIERVARENGLKTLREDGWLKVTQGITTIEEVVRMTRA